MKELELKKTKIEMFNKTKGTAILYVVVIYIISATIEGVLSPGKISNWFYLGLFFVGMSIQIALLSYLTKPRIEFVILTQLIVTIGSYFLIGDCMPILLGMAPVILLEIWNFQVGKEQKIALALVIIIFAAIYLHNIFGMASFGHTVLLLEVTAFLIFAALYTQSVFTKQFIELKKSRQLFEQLENVYDQVEQTTVEVERDRIARDFHDSIIQQIIGNLLTLEATANAMRNGAACEKSLAEIEHVITRSRKMVVDSRAIVKDLRVNRELSLKTRINILSNSFKKNYQLDVKSTIKDEPEFSRDVFSQLEMIIHECLINVAKHAGVNNAVVFGERTKENYRLKIIDFGNGFDVKNVTKSDLNFGLENIAERVRSISGQFAIKSVKGEGTTIVIDIPLGGDQYDKNNDR
ncbi:sensor histidine kinase [Loigolactobacillus iwatensis]|uniref:sensor histidine kinase n=1 Tax=Loigolactobacillus iwatensis TaxID=1267156 RepID=UPI000F7F0AEC|nr:sensor histidine kinase [Loigolactobacillus iwatensis]